MIECADLDPFNHGTTTIQYERTTNEPLEIILREGWQITEAQLFSLKGSETKYKAQTHNGTFLLKRISFNDLQTQEQVNSCVQYLNGKIKTPKLILPQKGQTVHITEQDRYCLYEFVEGEHYDGSQQRLETAATEIARMHRSLRQSPCDPQIKTLRTRTAGHDRLALKQIIEIVLTTGGKTDFDAKIIGLLDELTETSQTIGNQLTQLPVQIIHYDLHPHNMLFNQTEVAAIIDFDFLSYSQRARDVAFSMHRYARTCGEKTERKNDKGVDFRKRSKLFLDAYLSENPLTDEEIATIPQLIQDEALNRILIILGEHYFKNNQKWNFDLQKQITIMREGKII